MQWAAATEVVLFLELGENEVFVAPLDCFTAFAMTGVFLLIINAFDFVVCDQTPEALPLNNPVQAERRAGYGQTTPDITPKVFPCEGATPFGVTGMVGISHTPLCALLERGI
jgi:hypothetical protein